MTQAAIRQLIADGIAQLWKHKKCTMENTIRNEFSRSTVVCRGDRGEFATGTITDGSLILVESYALPMD
ncbi:hypothetical protein Tco_0670741 [Tanacetum coccineum]